jgi:hypothetical protein
LSQIFDEQMSHPHSNNRTIENFALSSAKLYLIEPGGLAALKPNKCIQDSNGFTQLSQFSTYLGLIFFRWFHSEIFVRWFGFRDFFFNPFS